MVTDYQMYTVAIKIIQPLLQTAESL